MIYHIKENEGRAKASMILLIITLTFALLSILLTPYYILSIGSGTDEGIALMLLGFSQMFEGFMTLVTGIVFMTYLWRAYTNLSDAGYKNLHHSRGAVIWGWIVPIASLFVPHRMVKDLFRGIHSLNHLTKTGSLLPAPQKSPLIGVWWGFWIASSVLSFNGFKADDEYVAAEAFKDAAGSAASLVSGICLLLLVRMMMRTESDTLHIIRTNQAKVIPGMPQGPSNLATGGAMPFGQTPYDDAPNPPPQS